MISFVKKPDPQRPPEHVDDNRFEQIRKAAAERHRKSDTDGTRRRARQTAEDNRLVWKGSGDHPEQVIHAACPRSIGWWAKYIEYRKPSSRAQSA